MARVFVKNISISSDSSIGGARAPPNLSHIKKNHMDLHCINLNEQPQYYSVSE